MIGRTTEEQMQIGIYWGYVAMIEGLVARLKAEIGRPVKVVATGGLATLFDAHTEGLRRDRGRSHHPGPGDAVRAEPNAALIVIPAKAGIRLPRRGLSTRLRFRWNDGGDA